MSNTILADSQALSVRELGEGYRNGAFSPLDICIRSLAHMDKHEPRLNAFIDPLRDMIMRDATRATEQMRQGVDLGPLHGIPVAVKDIIDIADAPTSYASKAVLPKLADKDAEVIRRLRTAGAIPFGKTNLLEFAYGIVHPDFGQTNNPWNLDRTAGGSSGGSAAAVAAGIVPLALGTDTGGSVRAPAAYCGVVGLKPSFGVLPLEGVFPLSRSLDHLGLLARSVADLKIGYSILADDTVPPVVFDIQGVRIGVIRNQIDHPSVHPGVKASFDNAAELMRSTGAKIGYVDLPPPSAIGEALLVLLLAEASLIHRDIHAGNAAGYAEETQRQIQAGLAMKAITYLEAQQFQQCLMNKTEEVFRKVDILLSPTVPFTAPAADPALIGDGGDDEILALALANITGSPAISIPCGIDCGMPVGLQLTAARGNDFFLLEAAS